MQTHPDFRGMSVGPVEVEGGFLTEAGVAAMGNAQHSM